jgi:hypothetical protein
VAWVYNTSNSIKLNVAENTIVIDNSLDRSEVIGDTSSTCGTPITNPYGTLLYRWGLSNDSFYVFRFNEPSNYTVFVDLISGFCGPDSTEDSIITQNYVCPWLGGTRTTSICYDHEGDLTDGWSPIENLTILVPNPDITIVAPTNELNPTTPTLKKSWNITNTGLGLVNLSIISDCGGWVCAFDGYAEGSQIQLEEGGIYTVTMNITIDPSELSAHRLGINVTYDDGYGFKSIVPKSKTSYIIFDNPYVT